MNTIKSILIRLMISLKNVEINTLTQDRNNNSAFVIENQAHQNQLMLDLVQGRLSQEVKDLRWRMYKILEHINEYTISIKQGPGNTIEYERVEKNYDNILSKVKLDDYDDYKLSMVIKNDNATKPYSDLSDLDSGDIDASRHHTMTKVDGKISVHRDHIPKFRLERYVSKMNVRAMGGNKYMLEFYVSSYADNFDRQRNIFINNIKQTKLNPRATGTVDIDRISFITSGDIGVRDNRLFEFKVLSFDKIIDFDGHFVIKFICEADKYGHSIIEEFRETELDLKYNNKEVKNHTYNIPTFHINEN